jgi:hypothetical protein
MTNQRQLPKKPQKLRQRKMRSLSKDKRGISSLFIAIYTSLLAVILLSTIFIGIEVSRASTNQYLQTEQDRMQEKILVYGPGGMRPYGSGDSVIGYIRVNNTGSITVRIRAFYIGQELVCDPSEYGDTYIAPKEAKWIYLVPAQIRIDDTVLRVPWTLATERGSKTSEIGGVIWLGKPEDDHHNPNEFYIGPLMILFDKFQWRTGTSHWESGWAIPKSTNDVTWRLMLVNVDTRILTLNDSSFFDLVVNDNQPKTDLKWYVSPNQEKTLLPGEYYYIEFSTDEHGNPQDINGFSEGYTCINFLTFTGFFNDGQAFGQTIPFEAVLITGSQTVTVTANPTTVRAGTGTLSKSNITATVIDSEGNPVPNQLISFTTTLGTLSSPLAVTDNNGNATVVLTAGNTPGGATVTAEIPGMSDSTIVTIVSITTTISLSPIVGDVTTNVTVSGTNYAPNSAITITYDGTTVATTTATSSGAIPPNVRFMVPPSTAGAHTVRARDNSYSATATFTVTPNIKIQPTMGPSGATIEVSGEGFAPSSTLTVTFIGTLVATTPPTKTTDGLGSFSTITFTVPSATTGLKIVRVTDASGNYDTATFTLGDRTVTLNPTTGAPGTTVTVTGSYFLPNAPITIKFDTTTVLTTPTTVTSSTTGTFSATFDIPSGAAGAHTVTASDSDGDSSATFTVTTPSLTANPTNGAVGTSVTLSGYNFAANAIITIKFDSNQIATSPATITTSAAGSFSASITIPSSSLGNHNIQAVDNSPNANSAQTTFTVKPSISITPQSGRKNTNSFVITVTGQNFASSSRITITFDGITQITSPTPVTTDTTGLFTATFTLKLPNNTQGHEVRATDSNANFATATFTTTN